MQLPGTALTKPLKGRALVAAALIVWLAGAAYCHGYERLLSGAGEWGGSLIWSAIAVMPWFALFEWSKSERGRRIGHDALWLAAALVATATLSLILELAWHAVRGSSGTAAGLMLIRRLPAIGASLVLILWAAASWRRKMESLVDTGNGTDLIELAESIDWVEAADNYVELHLAGRVVLRRMTMREAERQLARADFVRIHRRFLINRRKLEAIVGSNGDRHVQIAGAALPVGSRYASRLAS